MPNDQPSIGVADDDENSHPDIAETLARIKATNRVKPDALRVVTAVVLFKAEKEGLRLTDAVLRMLLNELERRWSKDFYSEEQRAYVLNRTTVQQPQRLPPRPRPPLKKAKQRPTYLNFQTLEPDNDNE